MPAVLIPKETSLLFSSDVAIGAENVSADGTVFTVTMDTPLAIPAGAMNAKMGVTSASIWNVTPNISADFGNNVFRYTTSTAPAGTFTIVVPTGLYSLDALGAYLSTQFSNTGHDPALFTLSGDQATQSSVITFLTAGDAVDLSVANSVGVILGWPAIGPVIVAPVAGYNAFSPGPATFNRVNSFSVISDIVSTGIQQNGRSTGVIVSVPITSPPGSQINYAPQVVNWFPADELVGNQKSNMRFRLVDQENRPTPTLGETWQITIAVQWGVLLSSESVPLRP
jgi:hypothetical protein